MNTDIDLELEEIRQANNGLLLPMDVVERAKSPNSALHHCFTWDDNEAAHQHRLSLLIKSCIIISSTTFLHS